MDEKNNSLNNTHAAREHNDVDNINLRHAQTANQRNDGNSSSSSQAQTEKQRNDANNANNVRAAAEVASKTNNPYAKAIGEGVKLADKISGGKASEKLGKKLTTINKMNGLKGKMMQAALNKMSESGTSDRIRNAASKSNGPGSKSPNGMNPKNKGALTNAKSNTDSVSNINEKKESESSDEGYSSFNLSKKLIKTVLIAMIPSFSIITFCCLLITSTQVFLNSISLGTADSLSGEEVDEKINKKGTEGLDEQKSDDDVAFDIYISDNKSEVLRNSKLNSVIQVAKETTYLKRKYNEASLDNIEDFYPAVEDLSKNYDANMVYDFFFKMYNLYKTYRDNYNVYLDLPLLMATLNLQSTDKNVIFEANLGELYRTNDENDIPKDELDYYYDWSSYKISYARSEHDMEVLAQHMVSVSEVSEENSCDNPVDNKCYKIDYDKYDEFLKEFLEKKYYLDGEHTIDGKSPTNNSQASGDYKNWIQCDSRWRDFSLGNSSYKMCDSGCLVTSIAIQIARSGTAITTETIDPGIASKKFLFTGEGDLYWNSVENLAPNFKYYTNINLIGMSKESVAKKLTSYNENNYYIILNVGKKSLNYSHHYVALDYVDSTNDIYIMDPASTSNTNLYDIYKIYNASIYRKRG